MYDPSPAVGDSTGSSISVSVEVSQSEAGELVVGEPEVVLPLEGIADYIPMPGDKRLLLNRDLKATRGGRMRIVQNWMPAEPDD